MHFNGAAVFLLGVPYGMLRYDYGGKFLPWKGLEINAKIRFSRAGNFEGVCVLIRSVLLFT